MLFRHQRAVGYLIRPSCIMQVKRAFRRAFSVRRFLSAVRSLNAVRIDSVDSNGNRIGKQRSAKSVSNLPPFRCFWQVKTTLFVESSLTDYLKSHRLPSISIQSISVGRLEFDRKNLT